MNTDRTVMQQALAALQTCFDYPAEYFTIEDNARFTMTVTGWHLRSVAAAISALQSRLSEPEEDLTAVYLVGFHRGKEFARAEAGQPEPVAFVAEGHLREVEANRLLHGPLLGGTKKRSRFTTSRQTARSGMSGSASRIGCPASRAVTAATCWCS